MKHIKAVILLLSIMLLLSFAACNRQNQLEENNDTEDIDLNETASNQLNPEQKGKVVLYYAETFAGHELRTPWFLLNEGKNDRLAVDFQYQQFYSSSEYLDDPETKAVIIDCSYGMGSYPEYCVSLLKLMQEKYPELLSIVVRPSLQLEEIADLADMVVFDDYLYWGKLIPRQAQKMNAKALVNYYYPETESTRSMLTMSSMEKECEALGLPYEKVLIDVEPIMENEIIQKMVLGKINKSIEKYGKDIIFYFYYPKSEYQAMLLYQEILQMGAMYIPWQPAYSSTDYYARSFLDYEVLSSFYNENDITYRFDYKWFNQRLKERMEELGGKGQFARDPANLELLPIEAAYQYAVAYANDNVALKTADKEFFKKCLQESMAEFGCPEFEVYVNTYEEYGDNCLFFSTDFIVY